jgi:hypothetical protein
MVAITVREQYALLTFPGRDRWIGLRICSIAGIMAMPTLVRRFRPWCGPIHGASLPAAI